MRPRFRAVGLVCVLLGCAPEPNEPDGLVTATEVCPHPLVQVCEGIDRYARQLMEETQTPGLAVALVLADGSILPRSYGVADRDSGEPVTPQTLFQIGSISKTFTALALLKSWEEGRFDPDRPITESLPWLRLGEGFEEVSGHHLLTHTAGLPANRDDIVGSRYMAWAAREQRAAYPPGQRFAYSNLGYQILHAALEHLEEESLDAILRRRFFDPLGMDRSRSGFGPTVRHLLAVGHQPPFDDRPWHRSHGWAEARWVDYDIGDGSVVSNAEELALFLRMVLRRGETSTGSLLGERAFERFLAPSEAADGTPIRAFGVSEHYGYGIFVHRRDEGRTHIHHSGGMLGYVSDLRGHLEAGHGVVALGNALNGAPIQLAHYALEALDAQAQGEPVPEIPKAFGDPLEIENGAEFAGAWSSPESGKRLEILVEGSGLQLAVESLGTARTVPIERHPRSDHFWSRYPDLPTLELFLLEFQRDVTGEVSQLVHGEDVYVREADVEAAPAEVPDHWLAYRGHYRSYSPWLSNFRILLRRGELLLATASGAESSYGTQVLLERESGIFQIGSEPTSETLHFDSVADGEALRVRWSGHPFYRVMTP